MKRLTWQQANGVIGRAHILPQYCNFPQVSPSLPPKIKIYDISLNFVCGNFRRMLKKYLCSVLFQDL